MSSCLFNDWMGLLELDLLLWPSSLLKRENWLEHENRNLESHKLLPEIRNKSGCLLISLHIFMKQLIFLYILRSSISLLFTIKQIKHDVRVSNVTPKCLWRLPPSLILLFPPPQYNNLKLKSWWFSWLLKDKQERNK